MRVTPVRCLVVGSRGKHTRYTCPPTSSTLPSIMSSPEPRKSKRTVIKEGTKKIFHRLFPPRSSSFQRSDVSSSRSESSVPSTIVPPSHTRHASADEFLKLSALVQDMGKYTIHKPEAGLLSNLLHLDIELLTSADPDQEKIASDKQPQVKEAGRF